MLTTRNSKVLLVVALAVLISQTSVYLMNAQTPALQIINDQSLSDREQFGKIGLLAIKGDPEAQYFLAAMFRYGHGTSASLDSASRYFTKSAEQNYLKAQEDLALFHLDRHYNLKSDFTIGMYWLKKAAKAGSILAHKKLNQINISSTYN